MKTFIFNSEITVYISNAETKEEAIDKIRNHLNYLNKLWIHNPRIDEQTRENRKKHPLYSLEDFENAIADKVYGMDNYEIQNTETLIYFHEND